MLSQDFDVEIPGDGNTLAVAVILIHIVEQPRGKHHQQAGFGLDNFLTAMHVSAPRIHEFETPVARRFGIGIAGRDVVNCRPYRSGMIVRFVVSAIPQQIDPRSAINFPLHLLSGLDRRDCCRQLLDGCLYPGTEIPNFRVGPIPQVGG